MWKKWRNRYFTTWLVINNCRCGRAWSDCLWCCSNFLDTKWKEGERLELLLILMNFTLYSHTKDVPDVPSWIENCNEQHQRIGILYFSMHLWWLKMELYTTFKMMKSMENSEEIWGFLLKKFLNLISEISNACFSVKKNTKNYFHD